VLSEINLPGISGLELLDELRTQDASVPFIILTSDPEVRLAVTALRKNVSGYLMKPAVERELTKAVKLALQDSNVDDGSMH
jgi:two-component system C4-dicarboxylate transport response regulator DctD